MTRPMRLAVIGHGKMGRAVAALAAERGMDVTATIEAAGNDGGAAISRASLAGADVAIEFTEPDSAVPNILATVDAGCPIVVGTTGWYASLPMVSERVTTARGALLYAPNFSVGVNLFLQMVAHAAALVMRAPGFDAHITEIHHAAKKDAPSGTAAALQRVARDASGREIPITSIRTGYVPGTHEVVFDAPFEQLRLEHVARDRRVFAEGALLAAQWLVGKQGIFTMRDVLASPTERT